ncbi:hypothetical protein [Priestia flexa]|uniref:hypothetical protein n=1 Tax=Priestia flexa TaxID=86664 RepID=UPI00077C6A6D|nr:hypothetical protein [Priestia flexa]MED4587863.1 hypothetical protein [Priestia flexa]
MTKERKQFNWRFKGDESEDLMKWFDNQRNITSSLESILNHIIELYGTEDIMNHQTQKKLFKDSMLLESLKGKNVISVNEDLLQKTEVYTPTNNTPTKHKDHGLDIQAKKTVEEDVKLTGPYKAIIEDEDTEDDNYMDEINSELL